MTFQRRVFKTHSPHSLTTPSSLLQPFWFSFLSHSPVSIFSFSLPLVPSFVNISPCADPHSSSAHQGVWPHPPECGWRSPSLPEGPASPLVCSEIASLARPSTSRLLGGHSLPSPRPRHSDRPRVGRTMAWLPGCFLCRFLLGWVGLSGEEGAGGWG